MRPKPKRSAGCLIACLTLAVWVQCLLAQPAALKASPFLNLRSRELQYAGPDSDCSDLPEIRLGWFGPSEQTNGATADLWWAANLAVREANEQGGGWNDKPFKLLPRWSENPWGSGVAELARLVYNERPIAVIGGPDSASTHLAEQIVAKANLTLVSPIATDKTATLAGVPWIFSCAPSDAAIAAALARAVAERRSTEQNGLALITGTDHESRMMARELSRELSRAGCRVDFRFEFSPVRDSTDEQMRALAKASPRILVVVAEPALGARLMPRIREAVPASTIYGSQQLSRAEFLRLAGPSAEGLVVPLLFAPGVGNKAAMRFREEFLKAHHFSPDYATAYTYDATRLLLHAIRQAGPHRAEVRSALARVSHWEGISGPISFDGTGQSTRRDIPMGTVRKGIVTALEPKSSKVLSASIDNPLQ